jgi:hypothetical protein
MQALVLLKWRPGRARTSLRRLDTTEALANVPLVHEDLGVFDLDHPAGTPWAARELARYAALLERVAVVEVTGGVDFPFLVDAGGDAVAR